MEYIQCGDYLIPNLVIEKQDALPLGKYVRMRKAYLKNHRPILFNTLLLSGKLMAHLYEIDETAQSWIAQFMANKPSESVKAADPFAWAAQMNSLKAHAEEVIMAELIYC